MEPSRSTEERRRNAILTGVSMHRQLIASFGTALIILLLGAATYLSVQELQGTTDRVTRTYKLAGKLSEFHARLTEAEIAHRGFLLTGADDLLVPYQTAKADLELMEREIQAMTRSSVQRKLLAELAGALDHFITVHQETIDMRERVGAGAALSRQRMEDERASTERVLEVISRMRGEEDRVLEEQSALLLRRQGFVGVVLMGGTLAAFLFAFIASVTLRRAVAARDEAERRLEERNDWLRAAREEADRGRSAVEEALRLRDETLKLVRRSEERLRALVAASSQVVWTASADGSFVEPQISWVGFTGQSLDKARDFGWLDAIHPDDRENTRKAWIDAVARTAHFQHEYRLRRADGVYRVTTVRAVPVRDAEGAVREWVGANTDVTERRRAEEEREQLIRALERSNSELDQFAYVTSHDLKAPLRGIASLATWIEEDLGAQAGSEIRDHLKMLRGRVRRLERLIDGILQYSRAGRSPELMRSVDLRGLLNEVLELFAPSGESQVVIDSSLPVIVGPKVQLQQVFINLISNAIKHGGPTCRVTVSAEEREGAWELSVTDDGPGIDPRFHDRIFSLFQTLESRDKVEGSGLGLAIVKKIVDTAGGRVWVESAVGAGARFVVLWPKAVTEVEARAS